MGIYQLEAPALEDIYRDQALVTKIDQQGRPICSSSQPSLMALQLEALDVHRGHIALEIGTGTGYDAALMSHLVGHGQVVSIDIDGGTREHRTTPSASGRSSKRPRRSGRWLCWV